MGFFFGLVFATKYTKWKLNIFFMTTIRNLFFFLSIYFCGKYFWVENFIFFEKLNYTTTQLCTDKWLTLFWIAHDLSLSALKLFLKVEKFF